MNIQNFITDHGIRAVIFDMDGVLIDSESFWQEVEVAVFQSVGVPMTPALTETTVGFRVDEVTEHWFKKFPWAAPSKADVTSQIVNNMLEKIRVSGQAKQGVHEALAEIATLGCTLAVASSSYRILIDAVLEKLQLVSYFAVVHSAEAEAQGKPHPGVFLTTAKKLGVDPSQCIVFEDSLNGVVAAKRAGMYCIAVPDEHHAAADSFSQADAIIPSLAHLRE